MNLFLAWVVFPLVLGALSLGCGRLLELVAGVRLATGLVAPAGFAVIIVVASFATMIAATAKLATPAIVALAVAGIGFTVPWRGRGADRWVLVPFLGVFAVYALPTILSGQATFAGYITLDDTSTWLAMTDHVMEHGRSLAGLPPSTYEATLSSYLRHGGYPVGFLLPLGVGSKLVGADIAWLFQPYIAYAAVMLSLSLYELARRLVRSPRLCALIAFVAAQPALLYGYAMWSGIKEVTSAALIGLFAALLPSAFLSETALDERSPRKLLPVGATVAAELAALSIGAAAWLIPGLAFAVVVAVRLDARAFAHKAVALSVIVASLSIPAIVIAPTFIRQETATSSLTAGSEIGNLFHPLSWLQFVGIWPAGDFRGTPTDLDATRVLIAVGAAAAAAGVWWAWRQRVWELLLYVGGTAIGALLLIVWGSPWIDGKAMATTSPVFPLAGLAACAVMFERGRRVESAVVAAAIAGGVLWSNALAYHEVWLAPRSQLMELERIGNQFSAQGPTLMTEYQPYGVRHFLRQMDPEGASELRRRVVPLLNGQPLAKGAYADLDRFRLDGIVVYRTLVLRRSPVESRPPSIYRRVWSGRYYEVWQRPEPPPAILEHLPLGGSLDPAAVPLCSDVLRLARLAGSRGRLAAAPRSRVIAIDLGQATLPAGWQSDTTGLVYPRDSGTIETDVTVPRTARYSFWLGGSFRDRLRLFVDGRVVADVRDQLNSAGLYTPLNSAPLRVGAHRVALRYGGQDFHPGSGGFQFGLGPLMLSRGGDAVPVIDVAFANARKLCGKDLDWIEAFGS
jgi:hypothetical protein